MDLQKIIEDIIAKLKADPTLLQSFAADPIAAVKKLIDIDLDLGQLESVVNGVKDKVDLSALGDVSKLGDLAGDLAKDGKAGGILNAVKGLFGK